MKMLHHWTYGLKTGQNAFQYTGNRALLRSFASASSAEGDIRDIDLSGWNTESPAIVKKKGSVVVKGREKERLPDYSPLSAMTKSDIAKLTSTEVGSMNVNVSESDIVSIDALSHQLYDMLNEPMSDDVYLTLREMNVDPLLRKVKDTLQVDDLPAAVKAMRVLSAQDRLDDVLSIWEVIRKNPAQCTRFAWTAYLTALATHGQTLKAREEMKQMVMSGLKPDLHVYGTIINGLVKEGSLDAAYGLSRQMTEAGIHPNNVVVASLIYGCIEKRQLSRADETFNLMRNYIEEADSITTSLMIKVAELQHNTEKAIHLFDSLEVHQQPVTQGCYHAVMSACAKSWRYEVMTHDYFHQMVNAGYQPTRVSYHLLLQACATSGDFCEVDRVLRAMQEDGLEPTASTLSLVLKSLGTASLHHLALPEHPAGNRRYTREEYRRYLQGYEMKTERDRLSYVRDMRKREIDDGLESERLRERVLPEKEEKLKFDLDEFFDVSKGSVVEGELSRKSALSGSERGLMGSENALTRSITGNDKEENTSRNAKGITSGLSKETIEAEIARMEGRELPAKKPTAASLASSVEKIVMDKYLMSEGEGDDGKEGAYGHKDAVSDLTKLESLGREEIMEVYKRLGGDEKNVDYGSALWRKSVEEVMKKEVGLAARDEA